MHEESSMTQGLTHGTPAMEDAYRRYAHELKRSLAGCDAVALLNPDGTVCWSDMDESMLDERVRDRLRVCINPLNHEAHLIDPLHRLATFPLTDGIESSGAVLLAISTHDGESMEDAVWRHWHRMQPVLDHVARGLKKIRRRSRSTSTTASLADDADTLCGTTTRINVIRMSHDPASGLLTRPAVEQEALEIMQARADEPHCIICIDIDYLHVVNDAFGFEFGDEAIQRVARLLQPPSIPKDALVGRVAGDEFVVFLPGCDTICAMQHVQAIQARVNEIALGRPPQRITLSASCGIARLPKTASAFAKGLAAAALACRMAKERGRNRTEVYLDVDDSMMRRHSDILSAVRVRAALDKDRLQIYGQRIVSLRNPAQTIGVECLVRLVAEDGQVVAPAKFLSAARRYQLSRAVDEWVIDHLLSTLAMPASTLFGRDVRVSVNISEQSLNDRAFVHELEQRIAHSDVAPGLILFEIAEDIAFRNRDSTERFKRCVRRLGCHFGLDNFGSGHRSLALLQELRPDRVKIDGQIVRDLPIRESAEATVRAVARLAAARDIQCVAEYAESAALIRRLRKLGVLHAQGNGLHEAAPLSQVLEALHGEESQQLELLLRQR
jgi:diguanylate cyclase (GGDEF)-like protein